MPVTEQDVQGVVLQLGSLQRQVPQGEQRLLRRQVPRPLFSMLLHHAVRGLVRMNTRNVLLGSCAHGFSCRKSGRGNKREALNLVDSNGNLNFLKKLQSKPEKGNSKIKY